MHYATRHMEAQRDILHDGRLIAAGERFHATEVDAEFYLSKRAAADVVIEEVAETPVAEKTPAPARRRGRGVQTADATEPSTEVAAAASVHGAADQAASEAAVPSADAGLPEA